MAMKLKNSSPYLLTVKEIEATSREEAVRLMESRIANRNVCVWNDGFEATDDVECECNGEENEDGEIEFD